MFDGAVSHRTTMLIRRQTTEAADRKAITSYISKMEPKLTVSDDSGMHDDLYGKRLCKQMLAELEHTLPETHHIVQINYDSDPKGYTESMGILLLVPAKEDDTSYAMSQHMLADRLTNKAFFKVCDWHPDDGGVLLSTYGVLEDGTLVIDTK